MSELLGISGIFDILRFGRYPACHGISGPHWEVESSETAAESRPIPGVLAARHGVAHPVKHRDKHQAQPPPDGGELQADLAPEIAPEVGVIPNAQSQPDIEDQPRRPHPPGNFPGRRHLPGPSVGDKGRHAPVYGKGQGGQVSKGQLLAHLPGGVPSQGVRCRCLPGCIRAGDTIICTGITRLGRSLFTTFSITACRLNRGRGIRTIRWGGVRGTILASNVPS